MNTIDSIKQRNTIKYLSKKPMDCEIFDNSLIDTLLQSAYWAPFHKPCETSHQSELSSILPFRFYVLDAKSCRNLAQYLDSQGKLLGKVGPLLNATDYLILATWLPNAAKSTLDENALFEADISNMEHIAATACAVQNMLLTATELGLDSYWSSGGNVLREDEVFDKLGVSTKQILLGSIYINNKTNKSTDDVECVDSKLRNKRGDYHEMYRVVEL